MNRLLLTLCLIAGLAGCATEARMNQLEATLRAYERAVRWSEFKNAFAIAGQPAPAPDFAGLREIKVVSYDKVGTPRTDPEGKTHSQAVEIRYVHIHNMKERVLTDQQEWVHVEQGERWKLTSPFPTFPK